MNAPLLPPFPPFPTNPSVGQTFGTWVWDGARWIPSAGGAFSVSIQKFTNPGVGVAYMPSPGLVTALVECVGGGGAGGTARNFQTAAGLWVIGGGGGGSGGYSRSAVPAALVAGGVIVTPGSGGWPTTQSASGPSTGGTTSFGALVIAYGGLAGADADQTHVGLGGNGAGYGVGDVNFPGAGGFAGHYYATSAAGQDIWLTQAMGGSLLGGSLPGQQGVGNNQSLAGLIGSDAVGAGAQGGLINQINDTTTVAAGGGGGSGMVIVTEYIAGDGGGGGCGQARVAIADCGPGWGGPC